MKHGEAYLVIIMWTLYLILFLANNTYLKMLMYIPSKYKTKETTNISNPWITQGKKF
jgi:uncharacterized MAPEG superfamily protein